MPADYFGLLGFTPTFQLDLDALEKSYFAAQNQYHPDRFVGKSDEERLDAMLRSVDINRAYRVLKEPLSRAQHLLSLQGVVVGTAADTVKPANALLMEVMELREDPPEPKTLAALIEDSITRIGQFYQAKDWQAMAQETLRLGYLEKASKA